MSARTTLIESENSSVAIKSLYEKAKAERPRLSLARFASIAGIPSKGYLHDVMNGKRILHRKYVKSVSKALRLESVAAVYFAKMVDLDHSVDQAARRSIRRELDALKKIMTIKRLAMPRDVRTMALAFEVYCAFGFFGNVADFEQLVSVFGKRKRASVARALETLESLGMIKRQDGGFVPNDDQVVFSNGIDGRSHIHLMQHFISESRRQVVDWFDKRSESYFDSMLLSVEENKYREALDEFKATLRRLHAELETSDADAVVRVSVQVYPVLKKNASGQGG